MIVTYAKCEACGGLHPGNEHPSSWPMLRDAEGEHYYCSRRCARQAIDRGTFVRSLPMLPYGLNERDLRILELVAEGFANKEIAWCLSLAESTVKNRLSHVFSMFGALDRVQLILLAHASGLVNMNVCAERMAARLKMQSLKAA